MFVNVFYWASVDLPFFIIQQLIHQSHAVYFTPLLQDREIKMHFLSAPRSKLYSLYCVNQFFIITRICSCEILQKTAPQAHIVAKLDHCITYKLICNGAQSFLYSDSPVSINCFDIYYSSFFCREKNSLDSLYV